MRHLLLIICLAGVFHGTFAQTRIQPGKLYSAGETIQSPKYGFSATIPEGWAGFLPQGTEVFALSKEDGTSGQVVMFARENSDLATLRSAWEKGGPLTDAITIKATDLKQEGDMIFSEVEAEGESINKSYKGFIIGRCGGFGPCISLFMITPAQFYPVIRDEMLAMMRSGVFSEPGDADPYADFDWQRFLANKMLVTFALEEFSKSQNTVDLCVDGTFSANVKRSGWFNQEGMNEYKGKNSGTWSVSSTGPVTVLRLEFNKKNLPPLEVEMKIEDEKIFANGIRYYAGYSQKCR